MRLESVSFPVTEVGFGKETKYERGILTLDKEDLLALVSEDSRIDSVDLAIANPGERVRISALRDAVEPRIKVAGGATFPGVLGPIETAGNGRTHRLTGVAVLLSSKYVPSLKTGTGAANTGLVDMWGPGAQITRLSKTRNVVLVLRITKEISELDAHAAMQLAEFKLAERLAGTTKDLESEDVKVYELADVDPSLPRIVYIVGFLTTWHIPHSGVALYGLPVRESLPTLVHPNEILDGAVTVDTRRGRGGHPRTWQWQNHPVIEALYGEHGRRLNFLGVIFQRTRFESEAGKEVTALVAGNMAKMLRADGAIVTRTVPSGNNFMDSMLTVRACERAGIKAVFVTPEYGGAAGDELPLVYSVPEADAIISTGSFERPLELPEPENLIGAMTEMGLQADEVPGSPTAILDRAVTLDGRDYVIAGVDWWGGDSYTCEAG
jgi:hypothetical protein